MCTQDIFRKVKVRSSDAVSYDPKEGFTLKLDKIDDPEGTYVCTAKYANSVRMVEYTIKSRFYETPSGNLLPRLLITRLKSELPST